VLAYCIAGQENQIDISASGVAGAPVRWLDVGSLRCFVSDFAAPIQREDVPEMAKAFHQVLQLIFAQTAIIPFRFPTIVETEQELRQFLESRSADYRSALQRLRDKVQMDVRITIQSGSSAKSSGSAANSSSQSGKKYLQAKGERHKQIRSVLDEFRRVSNSVVDEWIERDAPAGTRGFALLDRASLPAFLEKISGVLTPAGISARVTGPWPPSEFVEPSMSKSRE
jgi:hypothetical protein